MTNKILIVDDEEAIVDILTKMIEKAGYVVHSALTASAALDILESNDDINIILTDLNLGSDMDGISLCSKIKKQRYKKNSISSHRTN